MNPLVFYGLNHGCFLKVFASSSVTRHKAFDFDGLMAPCVWFRGERHVVGLARSGTLAAALLELLMVQPLSTTHERTKPPCAVPSRVADTTDTADRHATVAQRDRVCCKYSYCMQYNT